MASGTYSLRYAGETFVLAAADHARLKRIFDTGLAVSSVLFSFTPVGGDGEVVIAVGSGAELVLKSLG
jgi:hypothetical protein